MCIICTEQEDGATINVTIAGRRDLIIAALKQNFKTNKGFLNMVEESLVELMMQKLVED